MKKILNVLIVMALLFVGIGSNALAEEATINIFISMPEYADAIHELIDTYKEVEPDVTINYETTQNDYPTLLKVKLNSGEVPDIFSTTAGKEIEIYKEYSQDLSDQPLMDTMLPSVKAAMADADGNGMHGIAIKGNFFGLIYNKDLFEQAGISKFPETISELELAIEKLEEEGITPFTSGFAEWWVFKHAFQHFMGAAATDNVSALIQKFENGEASMEDYPILYDNFFNFVDLVKEHGDAKPLESSLNTEISSFATGRAAMIIGQGPWVEDSIKEIDPEINIGFTGYPVSEDPADSQVISGADQAVRISNSSDVLPEVLDFVNWWYTSDYGKKWFTDVAGVVPPVDVDAETDYAIIKEGNAAVEEKGSAPLAIIYSTDSFHMAFGEAMQAYVGGEANKDTTVSIIEEKWMEIDG